MRATTAHILRGVLFVILLVQAPMPTAAESAVQCYHAARGIVQQTLASDCKGEVVSEERAEALRKQRREYIQKVLSKPAKSQVPGKRLAGLGSGFFVARDGSVVTSHHVVDSCVAVSISPSFGEMALANSIAFDPETDLALLRADIVPPAVAPLAPRDERAVQSPAFVIGYPNRGLVTIEPVLSAVEILQQESPTERGLAIIVRGDVRQGNSGGPLLDSGGSVLGVVFAKVNTVNVYKATGQLVRDIGLAVPARILESFLARHGVTYLVAERRPPQTEERVLDESRQFLVQVGCWN